MNRKNTVWITVLIIGLGLVLLAGLTFGNYQFARENPGGNDFLVHWVGTRSLVTEGLNPYSDEVAVRIQTAAYGRPARAGEHELRVAYPLYSIVVFLPYALISDYTLARAAWMTTLEVGLVALTLLSLRLVRWRVGPVMVGLLVLFSLFWYHGFRPLINGNAVVLVAVLLVGGFLAIKNGADELAGILFAFSTIKPQVVVLVLVFVAYWALTRRRGKIITWMTAIVFLLSASAALFIPDWIIQNLREVIRYPSYNPPGTPRAAFMEWWPAWGSRVGLALTGVMVLTLLVEWWNNRKADFRGFLWAVSLTLAAAPWVGIQTDPGNFVVMLPALMLVFSVLDERWKTGGRIFVLISMLVIFAGLWAIFLNTVIDVNGQPLQSPVMFFPLPAYLLLTLFWVRWWAIEPPTLLYERFEHL